jgi:tetratricopeptide (TPR) repeat protein
MSDCTDKKFEKMLYAFELGILSGDDLQKFKLHLYECDYCFERAQRFQRAAHHIRNNPNIRDYVYRIDRELSDIEVSESQEEPRPIWKKRLLPRLVPTTIIAIVVLIILILKPWRFELGPTQEAFALENRVAVIYFRNMVDPEDRDMLGEIIAGLITTDLSASQYINVVSSQRLYDILKLLGREGEKKVSENIASQVARKAGARWMLTGDILRVEPHFFVVSQLVDVESGNIINAYRTTGEPGENVFEMVDRLTASVRNDLSLPPEARREIDRPVTEVTTSSPDAYRCYLQGREYVSRYYFPEAIEKYKKALEYDSTFAMAYFRLALIKGWQGEPEMIDFVAKALEYSDRATQTERWFIKSLNAFAEGDLNQCIDFLLKIVEHDPEEKEAHFWSGWVYGYFLGEPGNAIIHLNKAIEIDSLYKAPYQLLADFYQELDDFDRSIWALDKYIYLAPGEAKTYDVKANLYLNRGDAEQAIESFQKVVEIRPDFDGYSSMQKLGDLYLLKGSYAEAEACFNSLVASIERSIKAAGRLRLVLVALYRGKLENAFELLESELLDAGLTNDEVAARHLLMAEILREKGELRAALSEIEKTVNLYRLDPEYIVAGRDHQIQILAQIGEISRAEEMAEDLKNDAAEHEKFKEEIMRFYWYSLGCIELSKGDYGLSIEYLQKVEPTIDYPLTGIDFRRHLMLARAFQQAGRIEEAIDRFEKLLTNYGPGRVFWGIRSVQMHYFLGLAYEKYGLYDEAIQQYARFLRIWRDADPGLISIEDARDRLSRLKSQS